MTERLWWAPGIQPGSTHHSREERVPLSKPRRLALCKGPRTDDLSAEEFCSGHGRRETRLQHIACAVPLPALPTGRYPEHKDNAH